jgi:hypothetical protein
MSAEQSEGQPEVERHPLVPSFDGTESDESGVGLETFVGFVGDSPRPSFIRVYGSLALLSYCEIKRSDIVSAVSVDPDNDLSPTVVRVKADARVEYVRTDRLAGEASYVSGKIMSLYGSDARDVQESYADRFYLKAWPGPPPPITPVLYCTSQVYPPCP